ncbi:hypothetical protein R1flu_022322 [Riccia fluitans]|uniref:AP2/ERF domain-containing protein n=1 Tax=Riccia fluitans TaxID=41844 RepID=A0ABD1ZRY2_9MARC
MWRLFVIADEKTVEESKASGSQNPKRKKFREVRQRAWGELPAEIRHPKKATRVWLGTNDIAEEAGRAYDKAAIDFRGKHARLNLLDSVGPGPGCHRRFELASDGSRITRRPIPKSPRAALTLIPPPGCTSVSNKVRCFS